MLYRLTEEERGSLGLVVDVESLERFLARFQSAEREELVRRVQAYCAHVRPIATVSLGDLPAGAERVAHVELSGAGIHFGDAVWQRDWLAVFRRTA